MNKKVDPTIPYTSNADEVFIPFAMVSGSVQLQRQCVLELYSQAADCFKMNPKNAFEDKSVVSK